MTSGNTKIPMRMCVGCRQMREKKSLLRITAGDNNTAHIDLTGRAQGRGAYICRDAECLAKAIKTKAIDRALGVKLDEDTKSTLEKEIRGA